MRTVLPSLFSLSLCLLTPATTRAEEVLPESCTPYSIRGESTLLPAGTSRIVMLHNLSESEIWITHPAESEHDAPWSSRLQPNYWSALVLGENAFEMSCIESKPGHEQQISCEQTLAVCEWPLKQKEKKLQAPLWAGENMPMTVLIAYIGRHGFELPQKTQ